MTEPVDPSRAHLLALVDLLTTANYPFTVHVGGVRVAESAITYPYLVLWSEPLRRYVDSLDARAGAHECVVRTTAVGTTDDEVLAALDRSAYAVLDRRPTVNGRTCGLVREVPLGAPIQENTEIRVPGTGQPELFAVTEYRFTSSPA